MSAAVNYKPKGEALRIWEKYRAVFQALDLKVSDILHALFVNHLEDYAKRLISENADTLRKSSEQLNDLIKSSKPLSNGS